MAEKRKSSVGYVNSLSPMKKGRNGKHYYHFQLQTSPFTSTRTVGFDEQSHARAKHYHQTGSPVKLVNISSRNDQNFINWSTSITDVNSDDVDFERIEEDGQDVERGMNSIDIKLKELPRLSCKQMVNVEGVLTLGDKEPKEVTKRDGVKSLVLEDCIIEDETGYASIHVWENLINACESGKSYKVTNLNVKNFSGDVFLGTAIGTVFDESTFSLDRVQGPALLMESEKQVMAEEFKMIEKVSVFLLCQNKNCNKRMPNVEEGSSFFKCDSCGTAQKLRFAKKAMSARICAIIDGKEVWLSAFTEVMEEFLEMAGLTNNAKIDDITAALLRLENVFLKINVKSDHIVEVL